MAELLSVEPVLPRYVVTREDTRTLLPALAGGEPQAARFRQAVDATRIERRHLVMPAEHLVSRKGPSSRTSIYEQQVLELGEQAARRALQRAGVHPNTVDLVISISCTGYMLPSPEVHLIPRLDLESSVRRIPITELGCSAGVAGVALAADLTSVPGPRVALLVSVEVCSVCVQTEEPSDPEIIGNLLFGDGAAAAVIAAGHKGDGPELLGGRSVLWPATTDALGMRLTDTGLRLTLSPELPDMVRRHLLPTVESFLQARGVRMKDLSFWVVHPGGPRVLETVAESLGLSDQALRPSWDVWEQCGNVSSATVFFIMRSLQEHAPPRDGALGMMMAFGPGLTCEMLLMRARGWLTRRD